MGASRFWGRGALIAGVIAAGLLIALPPALSAASPGESDRVSAAAECRHGGWAALGPQNDPAGHFRNQGQCVRYMVRGGDPATVPGEPGKTPGAPRECKGPPPHANASPHAEKHCTPAKTGSNGQGHGNGNAKKGDD
jgi:hypothetical protein